MNLWQKINYESNNYKYLIVVIIVLFSFVYAVYLHNQDVKEWRKCNIETEGTVHNFYIRSNKSLEVEIKFKKDSSLYVSRAVCTNYLKDCFYNHKQQECIGQKCKVFYSCINPEIISYELLEQDTLNIK